MMHEHVVEQVTSLTNALTQAFGDDAFVVVHGSLALGDYQPGRSDMDVLVFVTSAPTATALRAIAQALLEISGQPAPIEISVLDRRLLDVWEHPAPFYFHYSEEWRDDTRTALDHDEHQWDVIRRDPDLSAHMVIAHHHGIVVHGQGVIGLPSPQDALAAVWYDIESAETHVLEEPAYVILNLCRTIRWVRHGEVHSKGSGGVAMLSELHGVAHEVVEAMVAYRRGDRIIMPDAPTLQMVARQLLTHITTYMSPV